MWSLALKIIPGQQCVNLINLVIGNTAEHVYSPGSRINAVEFGSIDQSEGDCHGFAPPSNLLASAGLRVFHKTPGIRGNSVPTGFDPYDRPLPPSL